MAKQAVLLFVRALIIGVILNLGIQYGSGNTTSSVANPQQIDQILSALHIQASTSINPSK